MISTGCSIDHMVLSGLPGLSLLVSSRQSTLGASAVASNPIHTNAQHTDLTLTRRPSLIINNKSLPFVSARGSTVIFLLRTIQEGALPSLQLHHFPQQTCKGFVISQTPSPAVWDMSFCRFFGLRYNWFGVFVDFS
jgi:hypothetical protein